MTGRGWRLHRIWGTAWYRDRTSEEARLRSAIEDAIAAPLHERTKKTPVIERPTIEHEQAEAFTAPTWTTDYRLAPVCALPSWVEPGADGSHLHMVKAVQTLVRHEAPIHIDIAFERFRNWWNVGRIGSNIRRNIELAIDRATVDRDGDFLVVPGSEIATVRTPTGATTREAQHVHLDELGLAAALTIRDAGAVDRAELVQAVARIFGWSRIGTLVDQRVNEAIDRIISDGMVEVVDGYTLTLPRE